MTDTDAMLPPIERRLHLALLQSVLANGGVPNDAALAAQIGITAGDLPQRLAALAAADYLALDAAGRPVCLYPLSVVPTPHVVEIGEVCRYAMCAIDALGMAAMLGRAVTIESDCAVCRRDIRLDVEPGRIARASSAEAVVVARRSGAEPACEVCCPFTLFACCPAHGEELATRVPETAMVSPAEALRHGEAIFGDLLGETLPARRRRSSLTTSRLRT